jgi:hypothetical protein
VITKRTIRNKLTEIADKHYVGTQSCHLNPGDTEGALQLGVEGINIARSDKNVAITLEELARLEHVDTGGSAANITELPQNTQFTTQTQPGPSAELQSDEGQLRSHSPPPKVSSIPFISALLENNETFVSSKTLRVPKPNSLHP